MSELTSHRFLDDDMTKHRIEFANGVWAELDTANNLCRVSGVEGFSGQWEPPSEYLGAYLAPAGSDLSTDDEPEDDANPPAMFGQKMED